MELTDVQAGFVEGWANGVETSVLEDGIQFRRPETAAEMLAGVYLPLFRTTLKNEEALRCFVVQPGETCKTCTKRTMVLPVNPTTSVCMFCLVKEVMCVGRSYVADPTARQ